MPDVALAAVPVAALADVDVPVETWARMCAMEKLDDDVAKFADLATIAAIGGTVAAALRRSVLLATAATPAIGVDAPGVVTVDTRLGVIRGASPVAEELLDLLAADAPRFPPDRPPTVVRSVALHAVRLRKTAAETDEPPAPVRVRTRAGGWLTLHGAVDPEDPAGDRVVVVIERSRPRELMPLLVRAYGLSPREEAVMRLVLRGYSTREIADRLHITRHTVQDHLKSVFDKTGVRSRRQNVVGDLPPGCLDERAAVVVGAHGQHRDADPPPLGEKLAAERDVVEDRAVETPDRRAARRAAGGPGCTRGSRFPVPRPAVRRSAGRTTSAGTRLPGVPPQS